MVSVPDKTKTFRILRIVGDSTYFKAVPEVSYIDKHKPTKGAILRVHYFTSGSANSRSLLGLLPGGMVDNKYTEMPI